MSRAWIAFYMGDYQKDTNSLTTLEHGAYFLLLNECWQHGHIPLEAHKRASVAKMTLKDWKKVAPSIEPFFNEDGTNKRATKEIAKAEAIRLKRAIAGQRGGFQSGISKAIRKGTDIKYEANANQFARQKVLQNSSPAKPSLNSKLESSLVAARDDVEKVELSGGSLATAHPEGALREPLSGETNRLLAGLERLRLAKQAEKDAGDVTGKAWVDEGTLEWAAHQHSAQSRGIRPRLAITRIEDGRDRRGAYFDRKVPEGYDEATGERIAPPNAEENAA